MDEELGALKYCPNCRDEWPDDEEFFAHDSVICRACMYELRQERRRKMAIAARQYRARQRQAAMM